MFFPVDLDVIDVIWGWSHVPACALVPLVPCLEDVARVKAHRAHCWLGGHMLLHAPSNLITL